MNSTIKKMKTMINSSITISQAVDFFKNNDNFTLICHSNPDGDTLGSGYGLCGALHILGKRARLICDDPASPRFDYLLEAVRPELLEFPTEHEKVVTVDVADVELIGSLKEKYPQIDLCIDHHISNTYYAKQTLLDTGAAACAELTWELIKALFGGNLDSVGGNISGISRICAAIYTGVSTDTGCFRYANTTSKTHSIAAELMSYQFDVAKINYLMFEMKTRQRIQLEQQAFTGIEFFFDGRCAMVTFTADMLEGIDPEDAGNVSVLPKQIEGVDIGVTIKERIKNNIRKWKISIRTSNVINAQLVCSGLGGGGHVCAAGCTLTGELETVKSKVLKEIEKQIRGG